jgi:ADP-ribose pyrophosphatase YjhB (NUDIX family)
MNFCSSCGSRVQLSSVPGDSRLRFVCGSCREIHYSNPKILVACLAYFEERVLLCRRALEPCRGLWALPAGFMENHESLEQAASRETVEETGVEIDPSALLLYSVLSLPEINQVHVTLRAELDRVPRIVPGPEALEVRMIAEPDVSRDEMAFAILMDNIYPSVTYKEIRTRQFAIHQIRLGGQFPTPHESRLFPLFASP